MVGSGVVSQLLMLGCCCGLFFLTALLLVAVGITEVGIEVAVNGVVGIGVVDVVDVTDVVVDVYFWLCGIHSGVLSGRAIVL
jgi:hypothetical protein